MKKHPFLLYPVVLFLIVFLIDKLFWIEPIRELFQNDLTYLYYQLKEPLLDKLQKESQSKNRKKIMVVLGSSRLLYFDYNNLKEFYPDWEVFNFSSAVTAPIYYDYILGEILKRQIHPDLLVVETDPNQFNYYSPGLTGSILTHSLDLPYVIKNASLIGKENLSFYFTRKLFAMTVTKPFPDALERNLRPEVRMNFTYLKTELSTFLLKNNGNSLSPISDYVEKDAAILESTSRRTKDWLYGRFKPFESQFVFFEKVLETSKSNQIPVLVVWPASSPGMEKYTSQLPFLGEWKRRIETILGKYNLKLHDMKNSQNYNCNAFSDGGHVSKECYRSIVRFIFMEYFSIYPEKMVSEESRK